jgi:hypothetical protein
MRAREDALLRKNAGIVKKLGHRLIIPRHRVPIGT